MSIPPIIYELLRWLTALLLVATAALGFLTAWLVFFRRKQGNYWVNFFFAFLLFTMSLTLIDRFLNFTSFAQRFPKLSFLPIYLSFSFAPLLFFYVKSRLYAHFSLKRNDFKHFILPTVQFALLLWMTTRDAASQYLFKNQYFTPFYGNFEKAVFLTQFTLYAYFAYRFILHERHPLSIRGKISREKLTQAQIRRHTLVLGWLKRMVKVLFILFGIYAFFILSDYFSFKFFAINLRSKALFATLYELSLAAMLFWLCLNGFFAWRRRI